MTPRLLIAVAAALAVAACAQTADPGAGRAGASPGERVGVVAALPAGSGCAREIRAFVDLLDRDLATGFVAERVHRQANADLADAVARCAAGEDAQARAALRAVKTRHGYPA